MTAAAPDIDPWKPSPGVRIAVGLLAGVGATGIAAGLGLIGTFLDVDLPLLDPSPLILLMPVVVVPGFAGAVLGGRAAVAAISVGAVAGPLAAIFGFDGSCGANMFAAVALAAIALVALVVAGLSAFAGHQFRATRRVDRNRQGSVRLLVIVGALGMFGWIAALAMLGRCP